MTRTKDTENIQEAIDAICTKIVDSHPDLDNETKYKTNKFLRDMSDFILKAKIDLPEKELIAIGAIAKQKVINN